jgi:hypothetical protein
MHVQELSSFLSVRTTTELVVDRSAQNELLKVTFNVRCAAVTVQVQQLLVVCIGLCQQHMLLLVNSTRLLEATNTLNNLQQQQPCLPC